MRHSRPGFYWSVALLLTACSHSDNYAPVYSNYPDSPADSAVNGQPALPPGPATVPPLPDINHDPAVFPPEGYSYHTVRPGETLYSIGVSSGAGVKNLSQWNHIPAPYVIRVGQKLRISEPDLAVASEQLDQSATASYQTHTAYDAAIDMPVKSKPKPHGKRKTHYNKSVKSLKSREKLSIISTDSEKMLKLSFQWPITGKVLKNFAQTSFKGIDIAGNIGRSVAAAHAGKVAYSGQGLIGFGKVLIIKHNEQYLTAYANVGQIEVSEGDRVEKGQVIAKLGQSGAKRASLHFEIRKNGKPVNPLKYLPK